MKIVYLYDKTTGEYQGEYEAQQSPLEPSEFIVPTYSTEAEPFAIPNGKYLKFVNNAWVATNDNRGIWYKPNGDAVEVNNVLEPIPNSWSRTKPEKVFTLEEKFEQVRVALQSAIDVKARTLGFSNGNALILYVVFVNPFQTLSQEFANWEVSVWVQALVYKNEVIAGTSPMVTPAEAVAMMPVYPV
jgi:hypothetical protein